MLDIHVLCGGVSSEHEIALRSAKTIINNLDRSKYNVSVTYIDKKGVFIPFGRVDKEIERPEFLMATSDKTISESLIDFLDLINHLNDPIVIPCIHGNMGEDGIIQGFLRTLGLRFIGNDVLSSAICMDKAVANQLFEQHDIPQARYYIVNRKRYDRDEEKDSIISNIFDACGEKVFVKPANNGSSVGVSRATRENILEALEEAFIYDDKVVVEEAIEGVELEIAVLGNEDPIASLPGSYTTTRNFLDYTAKYNDKTVVENLPHELDVTKQKQIKELAIDSYMACGCKGLARVDIFMDNNGDFFVNEINTFPGMTPTSFYGRLIEITYGISFPELLDKLIELAIDRFENLNKIKRNYNA